MKRFVLAAALGWGVVGAQAVELGISAQDAYAQVQQADSKVLLIDVRDPVEVMFAAQVKAALDKRGLPWSMKMDPAKMYRTDLQ